MSTSIQGRGVDAAAGNWASILSSCADIDPIRLHNTSVATGPEWYQALRQSEAAAADGHD